MSGLELESTRAELTLSDCLDPKGPVKKQWLGHAFSFCSQKMDSHKWAEGAFVRERETSRPQETSEWKLERKLWHAPLSRTTMTALR